ncbi:hypothetical protein RND81_11G137300 [Saponaria officinalis]|uniref:F-box domain-containing protein n=1 Tax=Saponaria officinalis TaxID=3572 RepID=A0AAW1HLP6_SAPOF
MKLRLRSLESKETLKIEVPNSCNLQQLKQIVILHLFPSSSSSSVQQKLLLSLNRKDELFGSTPEQSLQSLGVTSGDLIYYSQNPCAFPSQNPNFLNEELLGIEVRDDRDVNLMSTQVLECGKIGEIDVSCDERNELYDGVNEVSNPNDNNCNLEDTQRLESGSDEFVGSSDESLVLVDTQMEELSKSTNPSDYSGNFVDDLNSMEVTEGTNEMEIDDERESNVNTRYSVPGFLKNVYVKEVGDAAANGSNHKLLVIAVHAVLLESGFVGYDPVSGMKVDGFHLPDEWPSSAFGISLHYTLPEISSREVVEAVVLKFQTLGKYVNVYGSLPSKGSGIHRVCLDEPKFIPALSYVWKKSDHNDSTKLYPNQEIFEFWKVVKDRLSYPLLIELCERVGFVPPPCFMILPTELKLKIFEALPATDVAKVACVSSELHFVASNNDLWKLKYEEEFGNGASSQNDSQWKAKFGLSWVVRKKRKSVCVPLQLREPPHFRPLFPGRRGPNPNPFGLPFVIGGDYDRLPGYGFLQQPGRRFFRSDCDLDGFGI